MMGYAERFSVSLASPIRAKALLVLATIAGVLAVQSLISSWTRRQALYEYAGVGDLGQLRAPTRWGARTRYDIVMSYYNEDLVSARNTIEEVIKHLPLSSTHHVTVYVKGDTGAVKASGVLDTVADELVGIDNVGREGETYLNHIVRHYNDQDLADYTIFIQPHIAWDWVMVPRLQSISTHKHNSLGFMSLGPYVTQTCGKDSNGNEFARMADIYSMFQLDLCPPHPVLSTWAGQFLVSRQRILSNSLKQYQNLLDKFHAPPEHWIWKEGWWNNELSNPTLGHALERTWPVIFNCTDASIAETCGEGVGPTCQCLDT